MSHRDHFGRHRIGGRGRYWQHGRQEQNSDSSHDGEYKRHIIFGQEEWKDGSNEDTETERDREEQHSSYRERPPPSLRGREIGMWFARRSRARKEREQKMNRPTVSIDRTRERKLRYLLSNLKACERSPSSSSYQSLVSTGPSSSTDTDHMPGVKVEAADVWDRMPGVKVESRNVRVPKSEFASLSDTCLMHGVKVETADVWDHMPGVKVETADVWDHMPGVKVETADIWDHMPGVKVETADICQDSADSDMEQTVKTVVQTTSCLQGEPVIDLDEYDDDGLPRANVSSVVQYMKSHGDYPYIGDESPTDCERSDMEQDNPALNRHMSERMQELQDNPQFVQMLSFRKKLPSYAMRDTLVSAIDKNQVLVISGETGCGKTTQVPQFILDEFIARGVGSQCRLICTQPRRISAISVAERVASERCEKVNDTGTSSVGYHIRLDVKRPRPQGSILFCTTGIVLKFLESDPSLSRATHIILDEIHERDLHSDFLMIILKDLLLQRPDLKVILMSATLNAEMFSHYFNNCPMLNIPGYTFSVREYFLEDIIEMTRYVDDGIRKPFARKPRLRLKPEEIEENNNYQVWCRNLTGSYSHRTVETLQNFDYKQINLDLVQHMINFICTRMGEGAILVFVPGWEEIRKLHEMMQNTDRCKSGLVRLIPLHSLMPTVNQREVFDRPPPGVRKIVIATNIAETSITIDDVVFVVDCGKIKIKGFQPELNLTCLECHWVCKANTKQRRGRAGRVQPGHCFYLYTKFRYNLLLDNHPPEMLRTRLEELCLQIKLLHLGRIVPFISKAMQHPSMETVTHAINTLTELNALDMNENLLPLGYHLARMPVDPHTGKMILFGAMFCCLDPVLTVAASLSFKDAFTIPLGKEEVADRIRFQLAEGSKSDHIMLINAFKFRTPLGSNPASKYGYQNNLRRMLKDMKKQLTELLHDLGFVATKNPKDSQANLNSDNLGLIRAVMCAGLYPNVARITKVPTPKSARHRGVAMVIKDNSSVHAHPKSVNMRQTFFESKWMVFYHKLKTAKVYLHDSTMVSPYALLFFGGEIKLVKEEQTELVSVDDWITFKASASTAQLVKDLRQQLDRLLTTKIVHPGPTKWDRTDAEGALMAAIADLITIEDQDYSDRGSGIGGGIGRKG